VGKEIELFFKSLSGGKVESCFRHPNEQQLECGNISFKEEKKESS